MALAIGATIVLAKSVTIIELGCTATLPAVYMTTLVRRYSNITNYTLWTGFYALVYIVPLLIILAYFIYLFSSVRIASAKKQGDGSSWRQAPSCFSSASS